MKIRAVCYLYYEFPKLFRTGSSFWLKEATKKVYTERLREIFLIFWINVYVFLFFLQLIIIRIICLCILKTFIPWNVLLRFRESEFNINHSLIVLKTECILIWKSFKFEFVIKIPVSILTITRSVTISLRRPSGAHLKSRVCGLCMETGAVVLRVSAHCTVHTCSGRNCNISLMRWANIDIAPNKPVT